MQMKDISGKTTEGGFRTMKATDQGFLD